MQSQGWMHTNHRVITENASREPASPLVDARRTASTPAYPTPHCAAMLASHLGSALLVGSGRFTVVEARVQLRAEISGGNSMQTVRRIS